MPEHPLGLTFPREAILFFNQAILEYEYSPSFKIAPHTLIEKIHNYNPKLNIVIISHPYISEVEYMGAILASKIENITTTRGKYTFWLSA